LQWQILFAKIIIHMDHKAVELEKLKKLKRMLPPYLPYKNLIGFLESLKAGMPDGIDQSLTKSLSGPLPHLLVSALEYLHLIVSKTGVPTEGLVRLLQAEGADRQEILRKIIRSSYTFLFEEGFDLSRLTSRELQDRFSQTGARGDTLRKCTAFFLKAAIDAGMELSPEIKTIPGPAKGSKQKRRTKVAKEATRKGDRKKTIVFQGEEMLLEKILLEKFPPFNPEWSTEVQMKWFEGFDRLTERFKK